ncbi:MAG: carbohydrate-binding domain-containing protein [Bacteroidales bacterium]|nr:carbohydrate-binding domain-containing protein [Bacteroidales bacterium]
MKGLPFVLCLLAALMFAFSCSEDESLVPEEPDEIIDGGESGEDEDEEDGEDEGDNDEDIDDDDDGDDDDYVDDGRSYDPGDVDIEDWDGEWADDADKDVVGDSKDFFYENNTFSKDVTVVFSGDTAMVETTNNKVLFDVQGAYVTIDMTTNDVDKVKVTVSGKSEDGQLKLYGQNKFMLELAGLDLTCKKGPAINDQCKKRVFVHLAEKTSNYLTDAAEYSDDPHYLDETTKDDEDRKGCFFSEGNYIFSGTGALIVSGKHNHAIATDGYMYMRPGVTIVVQEAANNGIQVKGDDDDTYGDMGFYITGGYIYAKVASAGGKCIKTDETSYITGGKMRLYTTGSATYDSEDKDISSAGCIKVGGDFEISGGDLVLNSSGNGAKGISVDGDLHITGGTIEAGTSGGIYSYSSSLNTGPKPMKADGNIVIDGGDISLSAVGKSDKSEGLSADGTLTINGGTLFAYGYDDGVSVQSAITITGGRIYAYSESNDGIDSNTAITISGGLVIASSTNGPEEGLDTDDSRNFLINGGTVIATGGSQVSPSSSSQQKVVICKSINATMDETFAILDSSSKPVLAYELPRSMSGMALLFSSDELVNGSYTIETKGTISNWNDYWYGWYDGASWSGGSQFASFTVSSTVTTVGGSSGSGPGSGNNPGGGPGGR